MQIYPLAIPAKEASIYHADVHLRPSVIKIAKIISDAVHSAVPIGEKRFHNDSQLTGMKEWFAVPMTNNPVKLMPPSKHPSVWSKWSAMNHINAWWLIDFAYQLSQEYKIRFGVDLQEYTELIQPWMLASLLKLLPRPVRENGKGLDEFPVVLPPEDVVKMEVRRMTVVDIYRMYYATCLKHVRMKWTGRERPDFMVLGDNFPF